MNKNVLNNPLVKGAIIIILTAALGLTTNYPETSLSWKVLGFTTLGTLAVYFAQSIIVPGTSATGQLNALDLLKGLLVAIGNGLSTWAANAAESSVINVKSLVITMIGLFAAYILKQWQTPSPKS